MKSSKGNGRPGRSRTARRGPHKKAAMKRAGKRRPRKNRYTHIVFGLAVVAVIVFIFTRDDSDLPEPTPTTSPPTTVATTQTTKVATATTPPTTTTAAAEPAASAASTTSTAAPQEVTQVLNQVTVAYVEGLIGFKDSMTELVSELTAANLAWDDRDATGVSFRETASALADIVDRTRALAESVTDHPVPSVLEDLHRGPLGPVEQAAGLVPSAEAVLEGLRIPAPDDGSTRRAALADFNAAAEEFGRSVDELTRHVEENVGALGVTVPASTTTPTSTTQPPRELSDEAVAYIEGLTRFKEVLAELAAEGNAASQALGQQSRDRCPLPGYGRRPARDDRPGPGLRGTSARPPGSRSNRTTRRRAYRAGCPVGSTGRSGAGGTPYSRSRGRLGTTGRSRRLQRRRRSLRQQRGHPDQPHRRERGVSGFGEGNLEVCLQDNLPCPACMPRRHSTDRPLAADSRHCPSGSLDTAEALGSKAHPAGDGRL